MTGTPRAFATIDLGFATTAVSLIGRLDGRWRLLGALAGPASAPVEALLELLEARVVAASPEVAAALQLGAGAAVDLPRLEAHSREPGTLAVLAASERALAPLVDVVSGSGWRWLAASSDRQDAAAMIADLLEPAVSAVLVGAGDPPGGDERATLGELGAIVAAAALRRPELTIILAGSMAEARGRLGIPPERVVLGPRTVPDAPAWSGLRELLAGLRRDRLDGRQAVAVTGAALAGALDRRVELIEIGMNGGVRVAAAPGRRAGGGAWHAVNSTEAALVPPGMDEAWLERVHGWSTLPYDRHRLRDRLIELRNAPWSAIAGDGAPLRLAAARAAMAKLLERSREIGAGPAPDLLVVAGGAFAPAPPAALLLAVADVVRRPAAIQVAFDHARLLGPLGTMEDPGERDRLIAELSGDLLLPLGSVVMPAGIRGGRRAGRIAIDGTAGRQSVGLDAGALEQVRLPPGQRATVQIDAHEPVLLGARSRRIGVEVSGGIAGVLLDLRDVPLRLPDRREPRRELLLRWQEMAWPEAWS